jgi:LysR family transcriptional regulator, glycine cleavage system transcriptional activator
MVSKSRTRWRVVPRRPELTRRLPLGSLRVFVAVADCQSFTRAADMLGVSVGAVSLQIRALEQYLGMRLFLRDGRRIKISDDGIALLPRVRDGLAGLQLALDEARAARGSATLYISVLPSFALQWLSPRVPDFQAHYPKLHLRVESNSAASDFSTNGMHAGVRFGAGNWPGLHEELLLNEWVVPVCRPDLLEKLGPVESHDDLSRYPLIHSVTEPWSTWISGTTAHYWPDSGLGVDDSSAAVRLAINGVGLALARWSLIGDELRSGQLRLASKRITPYARRYYFVCLPSMIHIKKVTILRDWLKEQAAAFPLPRTTHS